MLTSFQAAVDLLEPMTHDPVDFVRQGAFIALSMILIQHTDATSSKTSAIRELLSKTVNDKHEDAMARFGASMAQGIIDAGGRNMTLSLATRAGTLNVKAVVGMALFVQFWYWFPLAHCLGLAFTPTCVIAIDQKLRLPKIDFECRAKESTFAYPSEGKKEVEKKKERTKKAELSTTARMRAREKTKRDEKGEGMDMVSFEHNIDSRKLTYQDEKPSGSSATTDATTPARTGTPGKRRAEAKAEPVSFIVPNMSRVTPLQGHYIAFNASQQSSRYTAIRPIGDIRQSASADDAASGKKSSSRADAHSSEKRSLNSGSIVLLRDTRPDEDGEYIALDKALWPDTNTDPAQAVGTAGATDETEDAQQGGDGEGTGAALVANSFEEEDAPVPASFQYEFPQ